MAELEKLLEIWAGREFLTRLMEEGSAAVPEPARAFVVAGLAGIRRPLMTVLPRSRDAEGFAAELTQWIDPADVALLPAWEVLPGEAISPTLQTMGERISVAADLAATRGPGVVVASVRAFLQRLQEPTAGPRVLERGGEHPQEELITALVSFGYDRNYLVEKPGEFAVRGGIVDVFPPGRSRPVRIDFFGDEVSDLREFSISSQRSEESVKDLRLMPVRELLPTEAVRERSRQLVAERKLDEEAIADLERLASGAVFAGMEARFGLVTSGLVTPASLLGGTGGVVVCDPKGCTDRASEFLEQASVWAGASAEALFATFDESIGDSPALELWPFARGDEELAFSARGWDDYAGDPERLVGRLREVHRDSGTVVVAAGPTAERAAEVMGEAGWGLAVSPPAPGRSVVSTASLPKGFLGDLEGHRLAIVAESDLFGRRRPRQAIVDQAPARASALLLELAAGDYVVHETYGVGRYHGMITRQLAGVSRDYLVISYAGEDRLYLPTEQLEAITRYTGGDSPRLHRLGSGEWDRAKSRARRAVADIAGELIVLYSKRLHTDGYSFAPDTPWQRQLEDSFPYLETPDQSQAIDEVKADMEHAAPMDRLICGDVGFGKTEIAVRAAFKAVQDAKQVAVLVPTTILAQQHHQTFSERFAPFPLKVAQLSRFLTPAAQDEVLESLAAGRIDVIVGTHRLLQADVRFHDLGLLVVDEEHRFGVRHKELIKRMRETVDAITMTATPIPRTLEMAMTAIRDLSLIDTPPADRRPVLTYVGEADERMIVAAIRRELARDGQVFFVHNRVRSIRGVSRRVAALVPGARVEVAHGQMSEGELEQVMIDVWDGKVDVLVCTTIIESGLDIPAMNTLVVERADLLGLAQLYQLRGRVGRARERAYAYFLYPHEAVLTDEARERLKVLSEFTELGSGFKIALRDLEIRGAGNLLGAEQSGHIAAIGFDLYMRMMESAVKQLKGETQTPPLPVTIDLPVDAFIPASYIERESLRMDAYRHIERIRSREDALGLAEELEDRYGPLPEPLLVLLTIAEIRAVMAKCGITEATLRDGTLKLRPFPELDLAAEALLAGIAPGATHKPVSESLLLPVPANDPANWVLETLHAILG